MPGKRQHIVRAGMRLFTAWLVVAAGGGVRAVVAAPVILTRGRVIVRAESAEFNSSRLEVVTGATGSGGKGVALKAGAGTHVDAAETAADLVFRVRAAEPGRYVVRTHAATDARGRKLMRRAKGKQDSLQLLIAIGAERPTERVVFVPWSRPESCWQTTGKFAFDGKDQEIRIWLPAGVILDALEIGPYHAPKVPAAATRYRPPIVPPATRPRLWVSKESLPGIRANLTRGENAPLWATVRARAAKPFPFQVEPGGKVGSQAALERAAVAKAFVFLMNRETDRGREAVELTRDYVAAVDFGNLLDITREIGRAIYSAALVYDWCYDRMSPTERDTIRRHLMRLADEMEIGWPPFRQMIVNGHGNEAQINRDLLAMAIAIYDEDPVPYRYCSYRILEELLPMRRFEYQSPRHNQGVSYGPYRFGWDLHAAWLLRRMTGKRVFDDNIAGLYKYWLYMRLPNRELLRDGDGFADGRPANLGLTPLLAYAYADDPIVKHDFEVQGGLRRFPMLGLLLNAPDLKPAAGFDALPLSTDFGPILGGMVARTGWQMGTDGSDVVVAVKGGGYQFGNHQHADAGSFQIYYRGLQVVDLGQYHFYGTPYDYNFCKRSVAHSMMLVVDPDEEFPRGTVNDGGARFVRSCPRTPAQTQADPVFANGRVISASFGPSRLTPALSYFSVDLTSAYSEKIKDYVRTFCFLNLGSPQTPAVLIVLDNIETARSEFTKQWQVNTLKPPQPTADGVILQNSDFGKTGRVHLQMLLPPPANRTMRILSGHAANSVAGRYFAPPKPDRPEAKGHRIVFSPTDRQAKEVFLTVLSMCAQETPALPLELTTFPETFVLAWADRSVVLSRSGKLLQSAFQIDIQGAGKDQLLTVTGLAPGRWSITDRAGSVRFHARVEAGRNTAFWRVPGGSYRISRDAG